MIDVFTRRIVSRRAHNTLRTDVTWDALKQAFYDRETDGQLLKGIARVRPYLSITFARDQPGESFALSSATRAFTVRTMPACAGSGLVQSARNAS